ncbi:MAG: hypothetical protein JJU11_11805 [Candidatus Sumerlaeia bacterium]|nr:hypothetical protein [Candidatus Sumerlaeia bacterium]
MYLRHLAPALVAVVTFSGVATASPFVSPEIAVDEGVNARFTRNTSTQAGFDGNGVLHLAYWIGGDETNVANPSYVIYRNYTVGDGWADAVIVDESFNSSDDRLGGRQPSLAIAGNDDVWIAWHDYRHVNPGSNSIDNIEIYIDRLPSGGSEFSGNVRLTETTAPHSGDNGYSPQIAIDGDGRVHVVWHDFTINPDISDIYYRVSDTSGIFPEESIASHRLTDLDDRGGAGSAPSFTLPAIALGNDGTLVTAWGTGTGGAAPMRIARIDGVTPPVTGTEVSPSAGSFFDPPRLVASPTGGIWLVYTDRQTNPLGEITLRFMAEGESTFGSPTVVASSGGMTTNQPTIQVDGDGIVHLVHRQLAGQTHLYYLTYDPVADVVSPAVQITESTSNWVHPALVLDGDDHPWLLFEEDLGTSNGRIWMARPAVATAVEDWLFYQ